MEQVRIYKRTNFDGVHCTREYIGSFMGEPLAALMWLIDEYPISVYQDEVLFEQMYTGIGTSLEIKSYPHQAGEPYYTFLQALEMYKEELDPIKVELKNENNVTDYLRLLGEAVERIPYLQQVIDATDIVKKIKTAAFLGETWDLGWTKTLLVFDVNVNNTIKSMINSNIIYLAYTFIYEDN